MHDRIEPPPPLLHGDAECIGNRLLARIAGNEQMVAGNEFLEQFAEQLLAAKTQTSQPSAANRTAVARPMPDDAPVTTTFLRLLIRVFLRMQSERILW